MQAEVFTVLSPQCVPIDDIEVEKSNGPVLFEFGKGDYEGHPFRGNQYVDATNPDKEVAPDVAPPPGITRLGNSKAERRQALREMHRDIEEVDYTIHDKDAGLHRPAGPDSGSPLYDLGRGPHGEEGVYPEDVYTYGVQYYGTGEREMDWKMYDIILRHEAHPNKAIRVYRARSLDGKKGITPGAWVTPVRAYARQHGEGTLKGEYKIESKLVHSRDLFTSGDSWLEWGYHPQRPKPDLPRGERVKKGDYEGHPFRGNQYTEAPGTLYHGTSVSAAESIIEQGLLTRRAHAARGDRPPSVYFTDSEEKAQYYSDWQLERQSDGYFGGESATVEFSLPQEEWERDVLEDEEEDEGSFRVERDIPPERVKRVTVMDGPRLARQWTRERGWEEMKGGSWVKKGDYDGHPFRGNQHTGGIDSEEFGEWFRGSKVVDVKGHPLRLYHGRTSEFSVFGNPEEPLSDLGWHYFSDNPEFAAKYALQDVTPEPGPAITVRVTTGTGTKEVPGHSTMVPGLVITQDTGQSPERPDIYDYPANDRYERPGFDEAIKAYEQELEAYKRGEWKPAPGKERWAVTHQASGLGFPRATDLSLQQATDVVTALGEVKFDWTKSREELVAETEKKKLFGRKVADAIVSGKGAEVAAEFGYKKGAKGYGPGSNIAPVYLNVKNPLDLRDLPAKNLSPQRVRERFEAAGIHLPDEAYFFGKRDLYQILNSPFTAPAIKAALEAAGHDGIVFKDYHDAKTKGNTYIAFRSTQVKSATGNRGTYDPKDPDIGKGDFPGHPFRGNQYRSADDGPATHAIHTTSDAAYEKIKREGIVPRETYKLDEPKGVATWFAAHQAAPGPRTLRFPWPADAENQDPHADPLDAAYLTRQTVPPELIEEEQWENGQRVWKPLAKPKKVRKGDLPGHDFRGNQYTGGIDGGDDWEPEGGWTWIRSDLDAAEGNAEQLSATLRHYGAQPLEINGKKIEGVYLAGDDIVEADDYYSLKSRREWVDDARLDRFFPDYEDNWNKDFWEGGGGALYHATTEDHAEDIDVQGLAPRDETRGISNRSVGSAVFTSAEIEDLENGDYGDVIYEIDVEVMKRDGLTPYVEQEPDVVEYELRGALASAVGLEDYEPYVEQGMSFNTVIVNGHIPAKYLKRVGGDVRKGDYEGHPFRGNQWTEAGDYVGKVPRGGFRPSVMAMEPMPVEQMSPERLKGIDVEGTRRWHREMNLRLWHSQADQYPKRGSKGIGYFKGELGDKHVDTLLFRGKSGHIIGVLNHYPFDFLPHEKKGNVNVIVHPDHRGEGIGAALMREAGKRWNIDLAQQKYTPAGAKLANALVRKKPVKKGDLPGHDFRGNQYTGGIPAIGAYDLGGVRVGESWEKRILNPHYSTLMPGGRAHIDSVLSGIGTSVDQLADDMVERIKGTEGAVAAGKAWYGDMHGTLVKMARDYEDVGLTPEKSIGMAAALSPNTAWEAQLSFQQRILAFAREHGGEKFLKTTHTPRLVVMLKEQAAARGEPGFATLPENLVNAIDILKGKPVDEVLGGLKVRSFYNNLAFPEEETGDVTIDTHMGKSLIKYGLDKRQVMLLMRAVKEGADGHAGTGYVALAEAVRRAGKKLGLGHKQTQAAYWVTMRGVRWPRGKKGEDE